MPLTGGAIVAAWGVVFVLALGELPAEPGRRRGLDARGLWGLLHTGVESHLAGVVLVMLAAFAAAGGLACLVLGKVYGRE